MLGGFYTTFTDNNRPQPAAEEEMSEGIRALLEISRNFKYSSKFEYIPYEARSQEALTDPFAAVVVNNVNVQRQQQHGSGNMRTLQPLLQQPTFRITGLPPATPDQNSSSPKPDTNYAMAVRKTLEPRKTGPIIHREPAEQQKQRQQQQPQQQQRREPEEPKTWFDRNGRRTVNAKEMEGGPKINGRSIVNGINLNSLKFVKPAKQCPKWDKARHRIEEPNCPLWHPRERCQYYPRCRLTAEVCGFGHPFCGDSCKCELDKRSLQMNHLVRKDAVDMVRKRTQNG